MGISLGKEAPRSSLGSGDGNVFFLSCIYNFTVTNTYFLMCWKQSLAEGVYCNHSTPRGQLLRRRQPGKIAHEDQKQSELERKLEQGQGTKDTGEPSGTCVGQREATCSLLHRVSQPCMSLGSTRKLV